MPLALSGCGTITDTVAGVFGPGDVGGTVDAHVVYRLRPDCPALIARTTDNGYTVMTPTGTLADEVQAVPELAGVGVEESGLFEGPVRTGEVVFRYIAPAQSETWRSGGVDVVAEVHAVRADLQTARSLLIGRCGEEPGTETADPTVPRIPGQ